MNQAASIRLPQKFAPALFGLILSGLMSLLVSGISTWRAAGLGPDFAALWTSAWLTAWLVAFPVVLAVAPLARRAVDVLVGHR
jgi:hypothetical protein